MPVARLSPPKVPRSVAILLLRSMRYECSCCCAEALVPKPRPAENAAASIKPRTLKPRMIFMMNPSRFSQQKGDCQAVKKHYLCFKGRSRICIIKGHEMQHACPVVHPGACRPFPG